MKIKGAILHQPVSIPGVMAPNMYINPVKVPGIQFRWEDEKGLLWKIKGKSGEVREGFFPKATVSAVEVDAGSLFPDAEKAKAKAA